MVHKISFMFGMLSSSWQRRVVSVLVRPSSSRQIRNERETENNYWVVLITSLEDDDDDRQQSRGAFGNNTMVREQSTAI